MNVTTHRQEGGRFWSAAAAYAAFSRPQPALEKALRAEYASMELDKAPRCGISVKDELEPDAVAAMSSSCSHESLRVS